MKNFLILFIIPCLLVACSDDEDQAHINVNKVYRYARTEESPVRLFVQAGEITDQALIDKVVNRLNTVDSLGFTTNSRSSGDILVETVTLPDRLLLTDTISFRNNLAIFNDKPYSYTVQENLVKFVALDTVHIFNYDPVFDSISQYIGRYRHDYLESYTVSRGNGVMELTLAHQERYARIRSNQLRFPNLFFHFYRFGSAAISPSTGEIIYDSYAHLANKGNNELNSNIFMRIDENDTLLVQESWLIFE